MPRVVCFSIPSTLEGILIQMIGTQSKIYKNRNSPLPPLASCMFPYLRPSWPISALSGDRATNANRAYAVLSRFIVSAACQPYFLGLTCPSPNPVLDVVGVGCGPAPHRSHRRPHLHSGGKSVTVRAGIVQSSLTLHVALRSG